MNVRLQPCNAVTALAVSDASVPLEPIAAGSVLRLSVTVTTEDGRPLPSSDAQQALTLSLLSPSHSTRTGRVSCTALLPDCDVLKVLPKHAEQGPF
jgi:hypothetical protein